MHSFLPLLGMGLLLALSPLLPSRADAAPAQEGEPFTIGAKFTLHSALLDEERSYLVSLPPGYETSTGSYPVLYLLDGDAHFHHASGVVRFLGQGMRIPELIVVAVSNTNRSRDFTPTMQGNFKVPGNTVPSVDAFPSSGGAERFLRFLQEELAPHIEARYRTRPYRILVGHSLGGLFAIHTLMNHPDAFNAYIAISPSLWWNENALAKGAVKSLARLPAGERFLYMSMGDEGEGMLEPIQQLARTLERARPARLNWHYAFLPNDHHGSTPHKTLYDGLESLFTDWRVSESTIRSGNLARVEASFAALSRRLGYEVPPPEDTLNLMGYELLWKGRPEAALSLFRRNIELHGDSANVHDSLGEALEAVGQLEAARASYQRALDKSLAAGKDRPAFRAHLARVSSKLTPPASSAPLQRL